MTAIIDNDCLCSEYSYLYYIYIRNKRKGSVISSITIEVRYDTLHLYYLGINNLSAVNIQSYNSSYFETFYKIKFIKY